MYLLPADKIQNVDCKSDGYRLNTRPAFSFNSQSSRSSGLVRKCMGFLDIQEKNDMDVTNNEHFPLPSERHETVEDSQLTVDPTAPSIPASNVCDDFENYTAGGDGQNRYILTFKNFMFAQVLIYLN